MASILERLKRIGAGGSDVTETRQTPAPIEERSIKKAMVSPGEKTYEFTYDVGRKNYIDPGAGFLFNQPTPPTRSASTPTRPTAVDPTRETQSGGMTQDITPVMPNVPLFPDLDTQETLTAPQRVSSDIRPRQLPPPVRQPEGSYIPPMPMEEPPTLDTTITDLLGRYKGLYGEDIVAPAMPDFTPTQRDLGLFSFTTPGFAPPGLMTPQLPQPNVPNPAMQTYAPDMSTSQMFVDEVGNLVDVLGNIIEPEVTQLQDYSDEELDAIIEAERLRTSEFDFLNQEK
jgi:hypothetical protein